MPDRSCPTCGLGVAAHQTLCPSCRTPVPSEPGPVAASAEGSGITFSSVAPRQPTGPPPSDPGPPGAPPPSDPGPPGAPPPSDPGPPGAPPAPPVAAAPPAASPSPAPPAASAPPPIAAPESPPAGPATVAIGPLPAPPPAAPPLSGAAPDLSGAEDPTTVAPVPDATAVAPRPAAHPVGLPASPPGQWTTAPPPAVAPTAPSASGSDRRKGNALGGVIALAAAAAAAAGVVLPWFSALGEDVSGWAGSDDAKVVAGLAAITTLVAAILIGGARSAVLRILLLVTGAATLGLGVFNVLSVLGLSNAFDAEVGVGLYLVIGGGVVGVIAGLVAQHRRS